MYAVTLVAMYDPSLKDSLKSLEESMPVVLAAFGMQDMGTTLLDFIITYLYKFVLIVTPFIYSIVMCYRLLAKYVENGSLAYLLNSKHGRTKIVITQWVNLFLGLVVMIAFNTGLRIVCCSMMFQRLVGYTPVFITQFRIARPAIIHRGILLYVCLPIQ